MMKTITYPRVPEGQCLGRNRSMQTGGLDIYESGLPQEPEIHLTPRTSKGHGSDACRIVIPREGIPAVVDALTQLYYGGVMAPVADPTPGRLARLVSKWRHMPFLAVG